MNDLNPEILSDYIQVGYSAMTGMLQRLFDNVELDTRVCLLHGVMASGDGGLVRFYIDDNDIGWMEAVYFGKTDSGKEEPVHVMPCASLLAGEILANLSLPEIVDYIDRYNTGKDPKLTDYVEEVI